MAPGAGAWDVCIATPADHGDLLALAALRQEWRGPGDARFTEAFGEWWRAHDRSHVAFIGTLDGAAVAMARLAIVDRVPGPDNFTRRSAYLQSVFVSEAVRNQGLGSRLIDAVLAHARTLGLEYLAVHPSAASFDFYRRRGFAETSRVLELDWRPPRAADPRGAADTTD